MSKHKITVSEFVNALADNPESNIVHVEELDAEFEEEK